MFARITSFTIFIRIAKMINHICQIHQKDQIPFEHEWGTPFWRIRPQEVETKPNIWNLVLPDGEKTTHALPPPRRTLPSADQFCSPSSTLPVALVLVLSFNALQCHSLEEVAVDIEQLFCLGG